MQCHTLFFRFDSHFEFEQLFSSFVSSPDSPLEFLLELSLPFESRMDFIVIYPLDSPFDTVNFGVDVVALDLD